MREITEPANKVSSKLTRSFHAAHPKNTSLSEFIKCSHTAVILGNDPVITSGAPRSNAMCNNFVPFVVVNTRILFSTNDRGYSNGELP